MRTKPLILATFFLFPLIHSLSADSWVGPYPRIFAPWTGNRGFKVVPPKAPTLNAQAVGTLFIVNDDGTDKIVWQTPLVNIPMYALVEPDGKYVITFDTYAHLGYEHALVIYDATGKVIADLKLEDLFTKEEIDKHVESTVSSRFWCTGPQIAALRLDGDSPLDIPYPWGKTLHIDPKTGKVTSTPTSPTH